MKTKIIFFVGFAAGYYYGSLAGIERHHQLNRMIKRLSNSGPVDAASGKAMAAANDGLHKAKDTVIRRFHHKDYVVETTEFMPS